MQGPSDLDVLIDEQSLHAWGAQVHPLEDRPIAFGEFHAHESQIEGSIQQTEMLEFLREYQISS